ncbi:MAG: hypothetical protein HY904_18495 [Deltaproteobacteria bacterium]|nr:hypothetical protein [Deltaproteobacteria bacterium]
MAESPAPPEPGTPPEVPDLPGGADEPPPAATGAGWKTYMVAGVVAVFIIGGAAFGAMKYKQMQEEEAERLKAEAAAAAPAAPAPPAIPEGPWERWDPGADGKAAIEKANTAAAADAVLLAGNKVAAELAKRALEPEAPVVTLKFGQEGADPKPPHPLTARLPTAQALHKISTEVEGTLGLKVRLLHAWNSAAEFKALQDAAPTLAAVPGGDAHFADAVDISNTDGAGKKALTLGTDGKVIFLEEVQDKSGLPRFEAVIEKIEADAIKEAPKKKKAVVQAWVDSVEQDFHNGVWGVHDATMEVWQKNGWAIGHCGEVQARSWHAEPVRTMKDCTRFSGAYNERIRNYHLSAGASEPYVMAAMELARKGGDLEPYLMPEPERELNDAVNASLPDNFTLIGFNRVSPKVSGKAEDWDAPIVFLKMGGVDRKGRVQRVLGRFATANAVNEIAKEIEATFGLKVRANFLWRTNAVQHALRTANPKLAALPGTSNHFVNAADISRAEATGKNVLTLGTDGKIIMLEDLKTPEGLARFKEVIKRIEADELKKAGKNQKRADKVVDAWVKTAEEDLNAGVWGMTDATMDIWRKHGWTTGHCGEIAYESWHTEPIGKMKKCDRWDATYNKRIKTYRKKPPPSEDAVFELVEAVLSKPLPSAAEFKKAAAKKGGGGGCKGIGCLEKAAKDVMKMGGGMFGKKK